jgi:uncharacterized protein (TIGR02271 family)
VVKYPIALEDISVYKEKIHDVQQIDETLKTEKLKIKTKGNANIKINEKEGDSSAQ